MNNFEIVIISLIEVVLFVLYGMGLSIVPYVMFDINLSTSVLIGIVFVLIVNIIKERVSYGTTK